MKNRIWFIITLGLFISIGLGVKAGETTLSADEIANKANIAAYYKADDGKAKVQMTITDKQGRTRKREFMILRKDIKDGGDQRFYVYFSSPADVRKMVFMVWKHPGTDDDRWLYLPAMDLVKRIAASDKRTSFVGSDFLYEDVSGRGPQEDKHELVETTETYWMLKNTPINTKSAEFDSYVVKVDRATLLPLKAEYYKNGKVYRVVETLEQKVIQGHPTITKSKASNLETGSKTTLSFSSVAYDLELKVTLFEERSLKRVPRIIRQMK